MTCLKDDRDLNERDLLELKRKEFRSFQAQVNIGTG